MRLIFVSKVKDGVFLRLLIKGSFDADTSEGSGAVFSVYFFDLYMVDRVELKLSLDVIQDPSQWTKQAPSHPSS